MSASEPPVEDPLSRARVVARLLDNAVSVPGTGIRLGLDPLLGLVPGLGDVAGAALSGYVVLLGTRLGAPRAVILRMLSNVAIDTFVSSVPLVGDAFDVVWKSNTRNVALLERYLEEPAATRAASITMVGAVAAALVVLALGGLTLSMLAVWALIGSLR